MQFYQLSQQSLAKSGSSVVEEYIPLWMADGATCSTSTTTDVYLSDGSPTSGSINSTTKLHTLSSNWSTTQQFALEATIYSSVSGNTMSVRLYDMTSGASAIVPSVITTTSSTATVLRSGTFNLVPGHTYGVGIRAGSGATAYCVDASLIIFGQ